jgi:phosphoribosylaminoimidazolecarboxamide formyltransferase/IMP cyclohydrolase
VTGFAEAFDGRVKTLHPAIHGGLLADLRNEQHRIDLAALGIQPFQLVVVNLYPFAETVASGATADECLEQIDIGGPAMVRASAKNHANVAVVVDPRHYPTIHEALREHGFTMSQRQALATRAFRHVAQYDFDVATWLEQQGGGADFPAWLGQIWERAATLRYGENPHQSAALYVGRGAQPGVAQAEQLQGKEMSFNNYVDADAARRAAYDFDQPAVVIIKHANPCGVAVADDIAQAYRKAHATDPVSAFGGVVATNREVSKEMAQAIREVFTEVVIAPSFAASAIALLQDKQHLRLLIAAPVAPGGHRELRHISGGVLMQTQDRLQAAEDDVRHWQHVAGEAADEQTLADLQFAWRAVRCVKSNAILLASNGAAVGIGMGQVNRVDAAQLAASRAGHRARGSVAASDAFFPFPDGLQVLIAAGVRAVVAPGGSVRDAEVVAAAQAAGVTMYTTGARHFFH